ncbi:MAG TPA: ATP-binding protein [Candidatus Angelobacter sp.]
MASSSGQYHPWPPPADCPICGGTGWKMIEVPGRASRATRCDCFLAKRAERQLKAAKIPSRYMACTLADFDIEFEGAHQSLAKARLVAGRFVEEYPTEKDGLLFVGPVGVGKTHLAVGIIQELIRSKEIPCLFCDYRELLKEIQNSYNPSVGATELEILNPVLNAEVLVLDDLGAIRPSQWVWDTVSYVINYRYNEKKTTIITTNFGDLPAAPQETVLASLSQTEKAKAAARNETLGDRITDRMRSRLHEMCRVIEMTGKDFRMGPRRRR